MKEITIKAPDGKIIDKDLFDKTGRIGLIDEIDKYPKSVKGVKFRNWYIDGFGIVQESLCDNNMNHLSSEKRAKAFLALMQLTELMDAYNKIDGGVEFQYDFRNYLIFVHGNEICVNSRRYSKPTLHFRKEKTRDLFLSRFRDLIEQAKDLI